jgi:hypothetical protein
VERIRRVAALVAIHEEFEGGNIQPARLALTMKDGPSVEWIF